MALGTGEVTATRLNVRDHPYVTRNGRRSTILAQLSRGDSVEIDSACGQWLKVRRMPGGRPAGFVHSHYIQMNPVDSGVPREFLSHAPDRPVEDMSPAKPIPMGPHTRSRKAPFVRLWNRCGGLIEELAEQIRITPATAVAVLQVESRGSGFSGGPEPRMIIRFENHVFWRRWGKTSRARSERFERHFKYSRAKAWQGHEFRAGQRWEKFHGKQAKEWRVFEFASALDSEAKEQAACSISMGGPQIMGFNHASIGFATAREMFDAFSRSEAAQITGLFDFVKGPDGASEMLSALQRRDLVAFATRYNGPGQAATYAERLEGALESFEDLERAQAISMVA